MRNGPNLGPVDDGVHFLEQGSIRLACLAIGIADPAAVVPVRHVIDTVSARFSPPPCRSGHHRASEIGDAKLTIAILSEQHETPLKRCRKQLWVVHTVDRPRGVLEEMA